MLTNPHLANKLPRTLVLLRIKEISMPRKNIKVRVPQGFDYEAAKQAVWEKLEHPFVYTYCFESAEEGIEAYREFEKQCFEGGGAFPFEYQSIPIYYHVRERVSDNTSVEDMLHMADFWDNI